MIFEFFLALMLTLLLLLILILIIYFPVSDGGKLPFLFYLKNVVLMIAGSGLSLFFSIVTLIILTSAIKYAVHFIGDAYSVAKTCKMNQGIQISSIQKEWCIDPLQYGNVIRALDTAELD